MQQRRRSSPFLTLSLLAALFGCSAPKAGAPGSDTASFASPAAPPVAVGVAARRARPLAISPSADEVRAEASVAPALAPAPARDLPVPTAASVPAPGAMLIRTGTASVEVRVLDSAVAGARRAAQRYGGVVANATIATGRNEAHSATLQVRIPAAGFDSLLAGLTPLGRVESVTVSAQDVGEEYVDLDARLANLRRLEGRIVELLATRTGKLADVLSVERELARIRGEIEQAEGRRRYLSAQVAMSTLELTLHEPVAILAGTPGENPIVAAAKAGWRNFVASVAWLIAALGVVIPAALVVTAGFVVWRAVARALPRRGASEPARGPAR